MKITRKEHKGAVKICNSCLKQIDSGNIEYVVDGVLVCPDCAARHLAECSARLTKDIDFINLD